MAGFGGICVGDDPFLTPGKPAAKPQKPKPAADETPPVPPVAVVRRVTSKRPAKNSAVLKAAQKPTWWKEKLILDSVRKWASEKKTQRTIAAWLEKTLRGFEFQLAADKGDNPLRLAYEDGCAECEQEQIDRGMELDPRNPKEVVGWIYFTKAQFGWRDKPENAPADGPKIQFILPGSLSEAEYFKKLGITGPIDTRPAHERNNDALGGMKDVTPGADGKLPVKVTTGESHILRATEGKAS
jgi:hypothetical protein